MLGAGTAFHTGSFDVSWCACSGGGKGLILKVGLRGLSVPKTQSHPVTDLRLQHLTSVSL